MRIAAGAFEATAPRDPRHLVLVDQALQAGPHPLHDLVPPPGDRFRSRSRAGLPAGSRTPSLLEARETARPIRGAPLVGNAADVEARPADLAHVNERDVHAQLSGPKSGGVATGALRRGRSGRSRCWSLRPWLSASRCGSGWMSEAYPASRERATERPGPARRGRSDTKRPEYGARVVDPKRTGSVAARAPETVAAVDRLAGGRLERDLGGASALAARGGEHLAGPRSYSPLP